MSGIAYFEIQAEDPARAMAFYRAIFSWQFEKSAMPIDYWRIAGAGMEGGLLPRPAPIPDAPSAANAYTCSMVVADFDVTAASILQAGGAVALEKFAVPGRCWQGYFLDTEGNTFGIFEVDPQAG